jgi:hypothetical protein
MMTILGEGVACDLTFDGSSCGVLILREASGIVVNVSRVGFASRSASASTGLSNAPKAFFFSSVCVGYVTDCTLQCVTSSSEVHTGLLALGHTSGFAFLIPVEQDAFSEDALEAVDLVASCVLVVSGLCTGASSVPDLEAEITAMGCTTCATSLALRRVTFCSGTAQEGSWYSNKCFEDVATAVSVG